MNAEEFFNNSWCTTADLIDMDSNTLGINTEVLFELMEDYKNSKL